MSKIRSSYIPEKHKAFWEEHDIQFHGNKISLSFFLPLKLYYTQIWIRLH